MTSAQSFPRPVRAVETLWIPLSDGCRLAARLWLPEDAEVRPVPAILEYIPYRTRDYMRGRDQSMHPYFAGHGYAAVRVDLRGSGESDGLLHDEYLAREQDDALEVIAWLAAQPWCTGAVGMMGKSWGAFNALQVAARRPPALKAIVPVMGTDDRFAEDVHYRGGCLLTDDFWWGSVMHVFNARPPDPEVVGARWREMWLERLEALTFWPETWTGHPARDQYWRHGSVCEDYGAIACPVYYMGGWADSYRDTAFRLAANLRVPWKVLIGPWGHLYPHEGRPGPAVGFLQEAVRWWDHWLKGEDSGLMDEPALRVWMQEEVPPEPGRARTPGRWVEEAAWPSPHVETRALVLNEGALSREAAAEAPLSIASPQSLGAAGGDWCSFAIPGDLPADQRTDDGGSLVFDGAPLENALEILGLPELALAFTVDRPRAMVAARLCDVAPDGRSTLVSRGMLDLTHRDGHARPIALDPGRRASATVPLHATAYRFAAGHRVRVALSTAYWPIVWPAPELVTLTVHAGASELRLPVRRPREGEAEPRVLSPPETAPALRTTTLRQGRLEREVRRDLVTGEVTHRLFIDGGVFGPAGAFRIDEIDLALGHVMTRSYTVRDDDPLSARAAMDQTYVMGRGAWQIRLESRTRMSATRDAYLLDAELEAFEGRAQVFSRAHQARVPRAPLTDAHS